MTPDITDVQAGMMRNALGLLYADRPYRNHFATFLGETSQKWADLCLKGLAEHYHTEPSGMMFFSVTDDGFRRLGVEPDT